MSITFTPGVGVQVSIFVTGEDVELRMFVSGSGKGALPEGWVQEAWMEFGEMFEQIFEEYYFYKVVDKTLEEMGY